MALRPSREFIVALCFAVVGGAASAQSPPLFSGPITTSVTDGPIAVAVGDLDGDGKLDVAAVGEYFGNVVVLLGQGDGHFGWATGSGLVGPGQSHSVALGDLSGDGKLDLAVTCRNSSTVAVLLGNGGGVLGPATSYGVGPDPSAIAIGDLNEDDIPDLAVASFLGTVSVLLGQGGGVFGAAMNYSAGINPDSVVLGDLSGDGILDVAVTNCGANSVSVLLGQGGGVLGVATDYAVGLGPRSVAMSDFNGDGKLDLAVTNLESNNVSVLLGQGGGVLGAATNYGVGTGPIAVAVADLSGDGTLDLAVANIGSNTISVLLGQPAGAFGGATNYGAGSLPASIAVGDFSGDGKLDLLAANYLDFAPDTVSVLLNQGPFVPPWTDLGFGLAGANGMPWLVGFGSLQVGSPGSLMLSNAASLALTLLFASPQSTPTSLKCGALIPGVLFSLQLPFTSDPAGAVAVSWPAWPSSLAGLDLYFQFAIKDAGSACGVSLSNALKADVP